MIYSLSIECLRPARFNRSGRLVRVDDLKRRAGTTGGPTNIYPLIYFHYIYDLFVSMPAAARRLDADARARFELVATLGPDAARARVLND